MGQTLIYRFWREKRFLCARLRKVVPISSWTCLLSWQHGEQLHGSEMAECLLQKIALLHSSLCNAISYWFEEITVSRSTLHNNLLNFVVSHRIFCSFDSLKIFRDVSNTQFYSFVYS